MGRRYRLYPTGEQEQVLTRWGSHCARLVECCAGTAGAHVGAAPVHPAVYRAVHAPDHRPGRVAVAG
ncbi:helix-turn-helix domain-containing protein [Streptomyces sp. NBC_00009]